MLPGVRDLKFYQGDTYIIPVRLRTKDPDTGEFTPFDLTGHAGSAQIRRNPNTGVITEFEVVISDPPTTGELEMVLDHERSTLLEHDCQYDLQTIDSNGNVRTWLRGAIDVTREITR